MGLIQGFSSMGRSKMTEVRSKQQLVEPRSYFVARTFTLKVQAKELSILWQKELITSFNYQSKFDRFHFANSLTIDKVRYMVNHWLYLKQQAY